MTIPRVHLDGGTSSLISWTLNARPNRLDEAAVRFPQKCSRNVLRGSSACSRSCPCNFTMAFCSSVLAPIAGRNFHAMSGTFVGIIIGGGALDGRAVGAGRNRYFVTFNQAGSPSTKTDFCGDAPKPRKSRFRRGGDKSKSSIGTYRETRRKSNAGSSSRRFVFGWWKVNRAGCWYLNERESRGYRSNVVQMLSRYVGDDGLPNVLAGNCIDRSLSRRRSYVQTRAVWIRNEDRSLKIGVKFYGYSLIKP